MSDIDDLPPLGPEDSRDLLAAEYVLGVLERDEAANVAADVSLQAAIAGWVQRLAPLLNLPRPVSAPAILWPRIVFTTGLDEAMNADAVLSEKIRAPLVSGSKLMFWRWTTLAASAAALGIAGLALLMPRTPLLQPQIVAALNPVTSPGTTYVAELLPDHRLRLQAVGSDHVPDNRDLELWVLLQGSKVPRSLGTMPSSGREIAATSLPKGQAQLLISLEPKGGSPTGLPTGPVLYAGSIRLPE